MLLILNSLQMVRRGTSRTYVNHLLPIARSGGIQKCAV